MLIWISFASSTLCSIRESEGSPSVVTRPIALIDPLDLLRHRLSWSTEEQDIPVRVANLEAAKSIVGILERHAEGCSMIGKFDGERILVWCIDEGISAHRGIALRVRERRSVFIRLDETLGSVAADDGEKRVSIWLLKSCLKTKLVAVKNDGLIDVLTMKSGEIACVVGRVMRLSTASHSRQ